MQNDMNFPQTGANGQTPISTPSSTEPKRSAIAHEIQSFLLDIEDLLKTTGTVTSADLTQMKTALSDYLLSVTNSVTTLGETIAGRSGKMAAETNDYVTAKPWRAIGIGAAAGFLVGLAFARQR